MLIRPHEPDDLLSSALTQMSFRSIIGSALDAGGRWAIGLPKHEALKAHALLRGSCWLQCGRQRLRVHSGDCLLTTGAAPLVIASELPAKRVTPFESLLPSARRGVITVQGGGDVLSITIAIEFDGHLQRVLLSRLPPLIHIQGSAEESAALRWAVERLRLELLNPQPGRALMLEHLAPIVFVLGLRSMVRTDSGDASWLRAVAHPKLSRAIEAIHLRYSHPWTLETLADLAGLSRSAFAATFRENVGLSPMAYVAQTRVQAARELLRSGQLNVKGAARAVGYESESAFSVAFHRIVGCRPGEYSRQPKATPPRRASGASR